MISELHDNVTTHGWQSGIKKFIRHQTPAEASNIYNDLSMRHVGWQGLLNQNIKSIAVLEDGLGSITYALANITDKIHALYHSRKNMEIVTERGSFLGTSNVNHILINNQSLSSTLHEKVDAFIIYDHRNLRKYNIQLNDITNILSSRGILIIGIYNTGLFSNRKNLRPPLENNFSDNHLLKTIRREFKFIDYYRYSDKTRNSVFIEPWKQQLNKKSNYENILTKIKTWALGGHNLCVAYNQTATSLFDTVLNQIRNKSAINRKNEKDLSISRIILGKPCGAVLLLEGGNNTVARISFGELTNKRYQNNHASLTYLNNMNIEGAPKIYGSGNINNFFYSIESMLPGKNIDSRQVKNTKRSNNIANQAIDILTRIQSKSTKRATIDGEILYKLVLTPLKRLKQVIYNNIDDPIISILEDYFVESFSGETIPLTLYHGDYSIDNIMIEPKTDKVTGVIDWDYSDINGLPLMDLLFFIVTLEKGKTQDTIGQIYSEKIAYNTYTSTERKWISQYCSALELNPSHTTALGMLSFVYFSAYHQEMENNDNRLSIHNKHIRDTCSMFSKAIVKQQI